jgi:serine protease Do
MSLLLKKEPTMLLKRVLYILLVLIVVGASALVGGVAGGLGVYQAMRQEQPGAQTTPGASLPQANPTQKLVISTTNIETDITQAVQKVGPAVVTVVGTVPGQVTFFGQMDDQTVSGSGIFISDRGFILTNNHVVEGTKSVNIVLSDGSQETASIVGTDPYSDIAILKADGKVPGVASLGNSDVLKSGETVIAIGSPLGDFKNTVTMGVVSATGRSIDTGNGYQIQGLIQTDAAINHGNSGGPLLNLAGEVIGINTLIVRNNNGDVAEGLGFAIPVNTAHAVAEQIMEKGYFARPNLGVDGQQITPDIAARYNLPAQWGIYVTQVDANGPAAQAGLQVNDIITKIGDTALDETHSYINALFLYKPGDNVTVDFVRNGKAMQVQVTLGESVSK